MHGDGKRAAVAALACGLTAAAWAQCPPRWLETHGFPGVARDGESVVNAMLPWDPDGPGPQPEVLVVGGSFSVAGDAPVSGVAMWDGSAWHPLGSQFRVVTALTIHDDGTGPALYAAGAPPIDFGVDTQHVGKWTGTHWEFLGAGFVSYVRALASFDSGSGPVLYAGGAFWNADTTAAYYIAKWDGAHWGRVGLVGFNSGVYAMRVFDDGSGPALYVGGGFSAVDGITMRGIARWNGTAWSQVGTGFTAAVFCMTEFDSGSGPVLCVGGGFSAGSSSPGNRIVKWNGTTWSGFGAGISSNNIVHSLVAYDSGNGPELYAGGTFCIEEGAVADNLARWNGSTWSAIGNGTIHGCDERVNALAVFDGGDGPQLYVGAEQWYGFGPIGVTGRMVLARWNGAQWSTVGLGFNGQIFAMTVFDDGDGPALYAAGLFTLTPGGPANYIARWDGEHWSALGTGIGNGGAGALAVFDDGSGPALYVGGEFDSAGGVPASNIARWDGQNWSAVGAGVGDYVVSLAVFDDGTGPALYAGGPSPEGVVRWDGLAWEQVGSGTGGAKVLVAFDDGNGPALYAGGAYFNDGTGTRRDVARWNGSAWSPVDAGLGGNPYITALAVHDDGNGAALFAAGWNLNRIYKWNGSAWSPWGSIFHDPYTLLVFDDGTGPALFAGCDNNPYLARATASGWTTLGTGLNGPVVSLAGFDDGSGPSLFAGGPFLEAGDQAAAFLARWGTICIPGDANCTGGVDFFDIDAFLLALFDPAGYDAAYPACDVSSADVNGDHAVNFFDIDPFVACLFGTCP